MDSIFKDFYTDASIPPFLTNGQQDDEATQRSRVYAKLETTSITSENNNNNNNDNNNNNNRERIKEIPT